VFGEQQTAGSVIERSSTKEKDMTDNNKATLATSDQDAIVAPQDNSIAPVTVAGQKYVPAAGRHSQQKRNQAIARGAALGFTTERELHDHDRAQVLAKLQKTVDVAQAQQRNEASRKTGV
jgi:hypothetical protein